MRRQAGGCIHPLSRFHSPADWKVSMRRHFPGTLFSVSPSIVKLMPSCLLTNERVAWYGTWKYGTFIMVAVAATNVGDIRADFDPDISTNNQDNLEVSEKIYEEPKIFRQVFELNNNIFIELI